MASSLKEGDAVQVVDREATPADEKNRTFFDHFRNTRGVLEKLYEDGTATVVLDPSTLPEAVRRRHEELTEVARKKWLDGLSSEARARLTPEEEQFQMRYTILVNVDDLLPAAAAKKGGKAAGAKAPAAPHPAEERSARKPQGSARASAQAKAAAEAPRTLTLSDLEKAEEEALRQRQAKARRQGQTG
jgi:hypothetical protein